jgi:radical SAM superfamily enzyme YgiQ (UPF0313 family)
MRILFFYKNNESLGIEYLSSMLKKAGHITDLLFDPSADNFGLDFFDRFSLFNYQRIKEKISIFKPDLIAFSVFTNIFTWALNISKYIKKISNIPILMGGPHPTIVPEYVIKKREIDYVLIGESDFPIVKLVDSLNNNDDLRDIPNLCYKKDGKIIKNELTPLILDLDELPFPDKDLFGKFGKFNDPYHIITARGCPYNCTYCINHQIHEIYHDQPKIRRRTVENVIEELVWAKNKYNLKSVFFFDDNFLLDGQWLMKFSLKYVKEIHLPFKCLVHPTSVNEKRIKILKKMGCRDIDMGIESGSKNIRENVFKRFMPNEIIVRSAMVIKKYKINLITLNIINNPKETPKDMIQTLNINRIIKPNGIHITSLYPYPNTEIYHMAIKEGILKEQMLESIFAGIANYRTSSVLNHPHMEFGERIRLYTPIFLKFPKIFHQLIFLLPPIRIFNILNVILSTSLSNGFKKIKEFFYMLKYSRKTYKELKKNYQKLK